MNNANVGVTLKIEVAKNALICKIFDPKTRSYLSGGPIILADLSKMNEAVNSIFSTLLAQVPDLSGGKIEGDEPLDNVTEIKPKKEE